MHEINTTTRYYFFSVSNFIAAWAGGTILGKGIGVINTPFIHGSSILAFFVGTVLGLIFLHIVPKKSSFVIARWFSILGGLSSLILLFIFEYYAFDEKIKGITAIIFFFLLSVRFGFWFYSRVLRASEASGQQQRIAWVEFGYYFGMIFGLVIWQFLGFNISFSNALILDIFMQFSAGFLDLWASRIKVASLDKVISISEKIHPNIESFKNEKKWSWRLSSAVIFLTIGIQVTIFSLSNQISKEFGTYILAFFYLGVSIAALFCKFYKIQIDWNPISTKKQGYAVLYSIANHRKPKISFLFSIIITAFIVSLAICSTFNWPWVFYFKGGDLTFNKFAINPFLIFFFVTFSAFCYEVLALAILDRIGFEERILNQNGTLMRTYGFMGLAAAIAFWLLDMTKNSKLGLILIFSSCLLFSCLIIWKRNFVYLENSSQDI